MLYDIILTLNGVARQASRTPQKNPPEWEYSIVVYCFLFLCLCLFWLISFVFWSLDMDGMASITAQVVWGHGLIWSGRCSGYLFTTFFFLVYLSGFFSSFYLSRYIVYDVEYGMDGWMSIAIEYRDTEFALSVTCMT